MAIVRESMRVNCCPSFNDILTGYWSIENLNKLIKVLPVTFRNSIDPAATVTSSSKIGKIYTKKIYSGWNAPLTPVSRTIDPRTARSTPAWKWQQMAPSRNYDLFHIIHTASAISNNISSTASQTYISCHL
jgi:hypothetical protein